MQGGSLAMTVIKDSKVSEVISSMGQVAMLKDCKLHKLMHHAALSRTCAGQQNSKMAVLNRICADQSTQPTEAL